MFVATQKTTLKTNKPREQFEILSGLRVLCGILCLSTWLKDQDLKTERNSQYCLAFSFSNKVLPRALSHVTRLVVSDQIAVLKESVIKRKRKYETASVWWANNIAETNCLFFVCVLQPQMPMNVQRTRTVKVHPFHLWKKGKFGTVHDGSWEKRVEWAFYIFSLI